ncbi:MAG: type II secretion system protein [Patescibacteria group bacterium]
MKSRGFTLIEIIVSLGIFSIVAVIAVGALVRVTSANHQAQAIQSGVNNVSFVLDAISREMRVGTTYSCSVNPSLQGTFYNGGGGLTSTPCPTTSSPNNVIIAFSSSNVDPNDRSCNLIYAYLFHIETDGNTMIYKAEETSCDQKIQGVQGVTGLPNDGSTAFYPVTSSSIKILAYKAGVYGGSGSTPYGSVFIRLYGYAGTKIKDQSVFDVETTISQRSQ